MGRWSDIATWRGLPADNFGDGDTVEGESSDAMSGHMGVVVHIAEGTFEGTISWERNPSSNISSHFVVAKDGRIAQMLDTRDRSWCQAVGNSQWISVECEGYHTQALTSAQVVAVARILAKANAVYGVPLFNTSSTTVRGLGHHAMGGAAWGGHYDCPGSQIIAQKSAIIGTAAVILEGGNVALELNTVIPGTGSWSPDGTPTGDRELWVVLKEIFGHTTGGKTPPGDVSHGVWPQSALRFIADTVTQLQADVTALQVAVGTGGISDAQVEAMAAKIAQALGDADQATIVAAVKQALREGTAA